MERNHPSLHRLADLLERSLGQLGVTLSEVDRRMAWKAGTLSEILFGGGELQVRDLLEVLRVAGIDERSFFAALYDLEPRCRSVTEQGEIPYSIGHLSEEDASSFPPLPEVLSLFQSLVTNGFRNEGETLKQPEPRSFTGADLLDRPIPED